MIKNHLKLGSNIVEEICSKLTKDFKGQDFSEALLIFPHKRPKFFIEKKLSHKLGKPFYSPVYFDMDLFIQNLLEIDSFTGQLDLYFALLSIFKENKNFSKFFKDKPIFAFEWAINFLDDFDKVQMELLDYNKLKSSKLPEETTFFEYFPEIYKDFLEKLKTEKMITRGMAYNLASQNGNFEKLKKFKKIYFVVPPGLTKSEKKILKKMENFENLEVFLEGFELDEEFNIKMKDFEVTENYEVVKFSSDHSQLVHLRDTLKNMEKEESVAIVLPKTKNLIPLLEIALNSFPNKDFNISMGCPVYYSNIFKFLENLFKLQINKSDGKYNSKLLLKFLSNPFIYNLLEDGFKFKIKIQKIEKEFIEKSIYYVSKEELKEHFKDFSDFINNILENFLIPFERVKELWDINEKVLNILNILSKNKTLKLNPLSEEYLEALYEYLMELKESRISSLAFEKFEDLFEFFLILLKSRKVNFKGHPLKGWQVLGFLETRTLSFDNVFILNLNEKVLPSIDIYDPVLPLSIKRSLDMPGPEEEEKIYKHHFLHLLNSSKKCHLYYLENEEEDVRSRFLEQIIWEKEKKDKKLFEAKEGRKLNIIIPKREELIIKKNDEILEFLKEKVYSPSSIDNYLSCPLKFYFENLLQLREKEELEEEADALKVGNILHDIMLDLFKDYKGKEINKKALENIKKNLEKVSDKILNKEFVKDNLQKKIFKELLHHRIEIFLKDDDKIFSEDFIIEELEVEIKGVEFNGIKLKGRLDRIDKLEDGKYRVVDYKSGSLKKFIEKAKFDEPKSFEDFQKIVGSFQAPVYLYLLKNKYKIEYDKTDLLFYSFKEKNDKKYFPKNEEELEKIINYGEDFLKKFLEIILDKNISFEPKPKDERTCQYCSIYICKI